MTAGEAFEELMKLERDAMHEQFSCERANDHTGAAKAHAKRWRFMDRALIFAQVCHEGHEHMDALEALRQNSLKSAGVEDAN